MYIYIYHYVYIYIYHYIYISLYIYIIIYHHISLYIIIYQYIYHYIYHYTSLYIYHYISLYIIIYHYISLYIIIYIYMILYIYISLYIYIYHYISLYISLYIIYISLYIYIYVCVNNSNKGKDLNHQQSMIPIFTTLRLLILCGRDSEVLGAASIWVLNEEVMRLLLGCSLGCWNTKEPRPSGFQLPTIPSCYMERIGNRLISSLGHCLCTLKFLSGKNTSQEQITNFITLHLQ